MANTSAAIFLLFVAVQVATAQEDAPTPMAVAEYLLNPSSGEKRPEHVAFANPREAWSWLRSSAEKNPDARRVFAYVAMELLEDHQRPPEDQNIAPAITLTGALLSMERVFTEEGDVPKASAPSTANLFGYFSPAYPDSIVVEATATGYEPATIEFPFASALWEERIPHYKGFTPGMPGWVVLGIGGDLKSTASKLTKTEVVSNSLALAPDDESIASIDPTEASVASTDTNVTGSKVGTTHVTAKDGETELARLQVTVKNEKEELIQFVYVKDTAGHDGTMANQAATLAEVKDIFLRQAVVVVKEKDDPIVWTIQDDMGDKPTEAAIKAKMAGHQRQPGVTYIYVWWDYDLGDAGAIHFGGIGVAVKKDSEPRSIAHELGHAFGLGHHAGRDNLMGGWGSPSGKRIEKFQADILNP